MAIVEYRTKGQIRDSLLIELQGMELSDDSILDKIFLEDQIDNMREVLINEEWRLKNLSDDYYQFIDCLEIQCSTAAECLISGITVSSEVEIFYIDAPQLVSKIGWNNIKYLGDDDFSNGIEFTRKSLNGFGTSHHGRWTGNKPVYTKVGSKIYLKNLPTVGMKFITMAGILFNPLTACNFDSTDAYPVPSHYKLELLVLKHLITSYNLPRDILDDARFQPLQNIRVDAGAQKE